MFAEHFQYNGIDYRDEFSYSLKKCEETIKKCKKPDRSIPFWERERFFKPQVKGARRHRDCKEQIYKIAASLARDNTVTGNMISLGAAYALEIYKEFSDVITERFTNVERDNHSYHTLARYYYNLKQGNNFDALATNLSDEDKRNLDKVYLMNADIFNVLQMKKVNDLGIIDLDLMQRLDPELIDKIYKSLEEPGLHRDRFLLAVWSTYGRSCTQNDYDYVSRPYLIHKFVFDKRTRYSLVDYRTFKYCDNRIPLKVELLVLENKK